MLSRGKSSWIFSGPIMDCSVTCQWVRVIWYFISSTRAGEVAIRMLPGWWRPTACRGRRVRMWWEHWRTDTNVRAARGPYLPCFSLQALVELNTVMVDLLEVDAWVVSGCQPRLVQGKESAMLDVAKHSPKVFSGHTGSMQASKRVRMPLNTFDHLPGNQFTSGQQLKNPVITCHRY